MHGSFGGVSLIGEIRRWKNISIAGLRAPTGRYLNYALASQSLARGKLRICETGVVSEVEFQSSSSRYTLVPEGERLIGGQQDRVVNASVLIPPRGTVRVAVSCVEQNRWGRRHGVDPTHFSLAPEIAAPSQRSVLKHTTGNSHTADQRSVWMSVGETVSSLDAGDASGSLSQAYQAVEGSAVDALDSLGYVEDANGIAVAIDQTLRVVEIFNNPRKLEQSWRRIVGSHLIEINHRHSNETMSAADFQTAISSLDGAAWRDVKAACSGAESRSSFDAGSGSVLSLDDSVIHASVVFAR